MMSNGPCSSPLVVPQRHPLDRRPLRPPRASPARRRAGSPPARGPAATAAVATAGCGRRAGRSPGRPERGCAPGRARSGRFEHDGDRQAVVLPGQLDQRLAGLGLDVGGVDDRQPPQGQPLGGDEVQHLERVVRDRLVVLVVADHAPAGVRREDLGGQEVLAGERALARPAGADQDDEGELGDRDLHFMRQPTSSQVPDWPNRSWASMPGSPAPTARSTSHIPQAINSVSKRLADQGGASIASVRSTRGEFS